MKNLERKIAFLLVLITTTVSSQIGVGTKIPHTDAMLEVKSTNKGFLLPRLSLVSTSSVAPLSAHVEGMSVYNTETTGDVTPGYYYNDGSKWVRLSSGSVADASATATGKIQLAGDLSGTAVAPTVANLVITTAKLAADAVTSAKILDATIVSDDIADNAVTSTKLDNNLAFPGTANITLPSGTTADRPSTPVNGMIRYNTTTNKFEMYQNSSWMDTDASPLNSIKSVSATYTTLTTDNTLLVDVPTGGITITLPAAADNKGRLYIVKKVDDDNDVLTFSTAVKVTAVDSFTTLNYATSLKIQSDGADWWLVN